MSPVASGGLPHTRATPANGGGPIGATNGTLASGMDSFRGSSRILPHLDDLVGVRPNVDIHSPFRTILQMGESLAKQAESHLDFRRPDIALQEYVKATIIAVDILPRHKDYSALQGDRPELYRLYIGLTKRINGQHQKFTEVKEMIKENNARSGVKPMIDGISVDTSTIQLRDRTEEKQTQNQSHQAELIGGVSRNGILTSKKSPPPVQPKPDSLHGKAIAHSIGVANGTHKADLAARFARLRSPEPSVPSQDPRIRTQPIVIPDMQATNTPPSAPLRSNSTISRPTGPREMPSVPTTDLQQPKISVNVNISAMPRPPDAIYSPDRGVESAATDLKSSATFSNARKYSAPPISTVGPSPLLLDTRREYFSPNPTNDASFHQSLKPKQPSLPGSTTISAEDLMGYIGQGSQSLRVLLVDLRSRDDFDSGHIMAQSIICVEPITLRHGISGEQLGETMVIASDAEQELYDQRQEFDLVVVYDQNSSTLTSTSSSSVSSNKIQDFISAVYDYGYEKRLKRPPVLLLGGLNAWIDLLGPSALKPTTIRSSISKTNEKQNQSLSRAVAIRNSYLTDKSKRRTFRQLTTQEQNYWDATLSSEAKPTDSEDDISEEFSYAKTTEDFFRRYPELPSPQQSMISPAQRLALEHQKLDDELKSATPKPPARPAPALPRQRSSGISDRRLMVSHAHSAPINSITERKPPALTGLENTGNSCYVNSIIQAFGATIFLRDILRGYTYPPSLRIPTKKGESGSDCPQLMVRCFGNLFGHLWAGRYDYVRPTTLLAYLASIDDPTKAVLDRFGAPGGHQQDAHELLIFLLARLEDELNPARNGTIEGNVPSDKADEWAKQQLSIEAASQLAQDFLFTNRASPLHRSLDIVQFETLTCRTCRHTGRKWGIANHLLVSVDGFREKGSPDLQSYLENVYGTEDPLPLDGFRCPNNDCGRVGTTHNTSYISHFPDYLIISLGRYRSNRYDANDSQKVGDVVRFGESFDLSRCFAPVTIQPSAQRPQTPPFKYQVCAVVRHAGNTLKSGHYTAIARHLDQPLNIGNTPAAGTWHVYNDRVVRPLNQLVSPDNRLYHNAAIIFLKRESAPLTTSF